eukprot:2807408-Pleurochrysis_carterae.AAC.2
MAAGGRAGGGAEGTAATTAGRERRTRWEAGQRTHHCDGALLLREQDRRRGRETRHFAASL